MFIRNAWYVAAQPHEVGRSLLQRWICGEPVVMYRTEAGRAVALADRCPHRKFALSKGNLIGDNVQCGYHGFTFDCTGACTHIPGQSRVPPRLNAQAYPLVEKHGWLWIWMGEAEAADESRILDFHWNTEAGWDPVMGYHHYKAHYQLLVDNLLDLTHETFVHAGTIGESAVANTPLDVADEGDAVRVERFMVDCGAPPLFRIMRGFKGNIDRSQKIRFEPPSFVKIDVSAVDTGTNDHENGLHWWVLNAITPETESSTHYFWSVARNFAVGDAETSEVLHKEVIRTFDEDREVLETQQTLIESDRSGRPLFAANCDAGGVAARRMVDRLLGAERSAIAAE